MLLYYIIFITIILPYYDYANCLANYANQVLDGAMACPPEDSRGCDHMGNGSYQESLDTILAEKKCANKRKYNKLCAEVATALNYKSK